ncbi:hypothetical protein [Segniliparus rugosus]|uniref:Uncharacterized protein n=1 Tax=Segniliparus rugosus (strain ATCC BAA-974 / DSM 45345 / CCUG 50838 / CIP 108380 / JCM 13579 / CDC 945) TaxID=679197 RepID=U1M206_SEGRC|nr:hypothetical protein [Segniliparus rugosus]ERG69125.1 hypothetical protein HMPREF9336_04269 [Segniliparus rugosus ATCC BAA-974]
MMIDGIFKMGLRIAHRGARLGIDAAQAGLDLAKAVINLLDPEAEGSQTKQDQIGNLLDALEAMVGLVGADRPLGEALRPGGAIDRLFSQGGLIDRLASADGLHAVIKDAIAPELAQLDGTINDLRQVAENLNAAATPLGRVAARVPKFLRKPLPYELEQQEEPAARADFAAEHGSPIAQLRDDGHALVNPNLSQGGAVSANGNGHLNGSGHLGGSNPRG